MVPQHKQLLAGMAFVAGSMLLARDAEAYRTAQNLAEFAGAGPVAWRADQITFVMSDTVPSGLAGGVVTSTLNSALAQWSTVACNQPSMRFGGYSQIAAKPGDGTNSIHWVSTGWSRYGFPAASSAMTDVQYQQTTDGGWEIVEADIYLNAEGYDWSGMRPDSMNLGAVVLHEGGHVLGLLHLCEVSGLNGAPDCASDASFAAATMFPTYQTSMSQVGADDASGVCYLYPGATCPVEGCGPGAVCTAQGCQPCSSGACSAGLSCENGPCVAPAAEAEALASQAPDLKCQGASCSTESQVQRGQFWDPCSKQTDCSNGLKCTSLGYCSSACSCDADCLAPGATCHETGECRTTRGVFGDACDKPSDCATLVCLEQVGVASMCTRPCEELGAGCSNGWICSDPDGLGPICMPSASDAGCGCVLDGRHRINSGLWAILIGLSSLRGLLSRHRNLKKRA